MTGSPERLGRYQLAAALGVRETAMDRACELSLLPAPGHDGRWPQAVVKELRARWPQITAAIEQAREMGAYRCAELLARATGLPVTAAHIAELATRGLLRTGPRKYRNRPLYRVRDVEALADDPRTRQQLAEIAQGGPGQERGDRTVGPGRIPPSEPAVPGSRRTRGRGTRGGTK